MRQWLWRRDGLFRRNRRFCRRLGRTFRNCFRGDFGYWRTYCFFLLRDDRFFGTFFFFLLYKKGLLVKIRCGYLTEENGSLAAGRRIDLVKAGISSFQDLLIAIF